MIRGPGVTGGKTSDALVGIADVGPTILELTEVATEDTADSRSFAGLLRAGSGGEDAGSTYAEYEGTRFLTTQRIIWEGAWKLVFNGFDDDELYNLAEDPDEVTNLAGRKEFRNLREHLMQGIWGKVQKTRDRRLLETQYSPMRFAVVGPDLGREAAVDEEGRRGEG